MPGERLLTVREHDKEMQEKENDTLRARIAELEKDAARLDWLGDEAATVDRIDRAQTYWFEEVPLRDAIDQAMKE